MTRLLAAALVLLAVRPAAPSPLAILGGLAAVGFVVLAVVAVAHAGQPLGPPARYWHPRDMSRGVR